MAKTLWNAYIKGDGKSGKEHGDVELRQTCSRFLSLAIESLDLLEGEDGGSPMAECKLLGQLLREKM